MLSLSGKLAPFALTPSFLFFFPCSFSLSFYFVRSDVLLVSRPFFSIKAVFFSIVSLFADLFLNIAFRSLPALPAVRVLVREGNKKRK